MVGPKERGMSRRSVNPDRQVSGGGLPTVVGLLHPKSCSTLVLTIALLILGVIVLIAYFNNGSGSASKSRPGYLFFCSIGDMIAT